MYKCPHSVEIVNNILTYDPRLAITGWFTNEKEKGLNKARMVKQKGNFRNENEYEYGTDKVEM